jgi:4-hydroxy-tetrahydrodipicolinate synthase
MLVTPFSSTGGIDADDLARLLGYVLDSGAHGVSILGLGGEVGRLTNAERRAIMALVLGSAGTTPVIVGCTAQDTATAVALALEASAGGAAALMIAPPSVPGWERARLLDHFATVARAVSPTPVMIQDAPAFVGVALDEELLRQLARSEANVTYAKPEGLPAGDWASRLVSAGFTVFGGHGGLYAMDVLEAGGTGLIPGCEAAGAFARMLDAWTAGDPVHAWMEYERLLPLLAFEFQGLDHYIACVKALLQEGGIIRLAGLRGRPDPLSSTSLRTLLSRAARAGIIARGT